MEGKGHPQVSLPDLAGRGTDLNISFSGELLELNVHQEGVYSEPVMVNTAALGEIIKGLIYDAEAREAIQASKVVEPEEESSGD